MNKFDMKNTVYFTDLVSDSVIEGSVITIGLSTTGYILYTISDNEGRVYHKEGAYVFSDKQEAESKLPEYMEVKKKIEDFMKESNKTIDDLRNSILGEPEMPEHVEGKNAKNE